MSTARDELAELIASAEYPNMNPPWAERKDRSPVKWYSRKYADVLIAAGYRKPCQITTVEELDALAVGSVVLHSGRAFQHYPAYPAPFNEYRKWKCTDGGFVRSTKDGSAILPATVLYEPLP
jgi:hypothetical protein